MSVQVVTVVTSDKGYFKALKESCKINNIELVVLGYGLKWSGYTMKLNLIKNYLKNVRKNDIIIFVDGYDVLFLNNLKIIKQRFLEYNTPILFSQDVPNTLLKQYAYKKIFVGCKDNKYLCTGLYMGYTYALLMFYNKLCSIFDCSNEKMNDQIIVSKFCSDYFFDKYVKIDIHNKIFLNIYSDKSPMIDNSIKSSDIDKYDPCIIHAPGNGNLNEIVEKYNFKYNVDNFNNIKFYMNKIDDYSLYFIPETIGIIFLILLFLIIVIVIVYKYKKQ